MIEAMISVGNSLTIAGGGERDVLVMGGEMV
jgi:hypothetical protein